MALVFGQVADPTCLSPKTSQNTSTGLNQKRISLLRSSCGFRIHRSTSSGYGHLVRWVTSLRLGGGTSPKSSALIEGSFEGETTAQEFNTGRSPFKANGWTSLGAGKVESSTEVPKIRGIPAHGAESRGVPPYSAQTKRKHG